MGKNDSALRAMLEALDAELGRRSLDEGHCRAAGGTGVRWLAEGAAPRGLAVDDVFERIG